MASEKFKDSSSELLLGRWLANPPPGEEVVITGVSGKFPNSSNIETFKENLFNKADLFSSTKRRWDLEDPDIPPRIGVTPQMDVFDAGFFGLHPQQIAVMCPEYRLLLEQTVEAIFDAGLHPSELEGTRTNVYTCLNLCDHKPCFCIRDNIFAIRGYGKTYAPSTISYMLKLNGNSINLDTACSSSFTALEDAFRSIRTGKCDNAIITSAQIIMDPKTTWKFAKLGVLSPDGIIRPFDEDANGYVRSEAAVAIVIQKAKNARRIYSEIVHCKVNQDGYKEDGITHPSLDAQLMICSELYDECGIDPAMVSYLEAHGTGTKAGDALELACIIDIFCRNRDKPLPVGSVKSNIGHTECCSGLCSLVKVIIAMRSGYIPPNVNFKTIRKEIESMAAGKIHVVTDKFPLEGECPLVGISNFGFGGANAHTLLRGYKKKSATQPKDDLPRLACVSGRTEEAVTLLLDEIKKNRSNYESIAFINHIFKYDIPTHRFRGFSVVSKTAIVKESIGFLHTLKKKLVVYFDNVDDKWLNYGKDLSAMPLFSGTIQRIHDILSKKGINITESIVNCQNLESPLVVFLASFSVQLAIADVLKSLDVKCDCTLGISTGDLISNYFKDNLTLEQVILIAYSYGNLLKIDKSDKVKNDDAKPEIIEEVSKRKMNGHANGESQNHTNVDDTIKRRFEICADKAEAKNFAIHLQQIMAHSGKNNGKFLENINETVENMALNLLNSNTINMERFAFDSVVLEVGFGTLDIYKDEHEGTSHIHFNSFPNKNGVVLLAEILGNLYLAGHNYCMEKLYPKVNFPVSYGTPMVSPLIGWNHSEKVAECRYENFANKIRQEKLINVGENEWAFLKGHVIDGRNLFPATGYLYLVWEAVSKANDASMFATTVTFEDVRFIRATTIPEDKELQLVIMIYKGTSKFEVFDGDTLIVHGKVSLTSENKMEISVTNNLKLQMKEKDIYKELKLRGYNYSGLFRSMRQCNLDGTVGTIQWQNNWIAFLDNLLQIQILTKDTRNLYVPTEIRKLVINPGNHLKLMNTYATRDPVLPITVNQHTSVIRCSFIEIEGLDATAIPRRRPLGEPVLEKYVFIPNETFLTLQESVRVNMQIALENNWLVDVVTYELIDEESRDDVEPLSPFVLGALEDQPLIRPTVTILTEKNIKIPNVKVENKKLAQDMACFLIAATNLSKRKQLLQQSLDLAKDGYILSRESLDFESTTTFDGAEILTVHTTQNEKLVFLHKIPQTKTQSVIRITNTDTFDWLQTLKSFYAEEKDVILYAQDEPTNGILGLTNCLRREPYGKRTKCVFIDDKTAPRLQTNSDFYQKQLKKGAAINVYKNGAWGTYRHLLLEEPESADTTEHVFVNVKTRGDLSSLRWFEGPLKENDDVEPESRMIKIYYAPLNFRDAMVVSGKLHPDLIESRRIKQDCGEGFEFVGKDLKGNRVMGITIAGAMSSLAVVKNSFIYSIPDNWSMEEASTVVVVYTTVLYALLKRVHIRSGHSILIHSGTGGVGQAAINVCLHFGLKIFTTVGTQEKREFIKKQFPQITDNQIGNSRNTSFEKMILRETHGRGVDYVLNSLSEEKLLASVRCVAKGGHFVEIGKFDLSKNNPLNMHLFTKGISFHGVMVDYFFNSDPATQTVLQGLLLKGIKEGYVKPLNSTVFEPDQVEDAFRYLAGGKHMGKVVLQVRNEKESPTNFRGIPRYFCNCEHSYIVTGGLGGFGLELADWLVLRGARKLVLTSRTGVKTGYQAHRIKCWESYGVEVKISTANISTKEGCVQLIQEANKTGPVHSIFNLAVVLADAILENQTEDSFATSFGPKAWAVRHLDEISRKECPHLKDFVVFSSVSCGRGNAGQTNYGMANSVMERICEQRHKAGLPALAIEWGAVGDVGLVAEMQLNHMELEIAGTLQQRVSNCLAVLDTLLKQKNAIVSSMIVAEKKCSAGGDNLIEAIANVIGIRDLKTVSHYTPLPELGMDSIMVVEVKQIIERELQLVLSPSELKNLTFSKLQEFLNKEVEIKEIPVAPENIDKEIDILISGLGDETFANLDTVVLPSDVQDIENSSVVFLLPGIEGTAQHLQKLAKILKFKTICLQYSGNCNQRSIEKLAESLLPKILETVQPGKPFRLVAHSFGTVIAVHLISLLEAQGLTGKAVFIDGSPELVKRQSLLRYNFDSDDVLETEVLCAVMVFYMPISDIKFMKAKFLGASSFQERIEIIFSTAHSDLNSSKNYLTQTLKEVVDRFKALVDYVPKIAKISSSVTLCRPKTVIVADISEDYGLSEILGQNIPVKYFSGNHVTILDDLDLSEFVNEFL